MAILMMEGMKRKFIIILRSIRNTRGAGNWPATYTVSTHNGKMAPGESENVFLKAS